jgi:hypothetical protein
MTQLAPGPLLSKSRPSGTLGQAAVASLGQARDQRLVVQDFCPFPQSLEWELGQAYLREKGSQAFIRDFAPVPHVVNNDGNLSLAAAQLLFTALRDAEQDQKRIGDIQDSSGGKRPAGEVSDVPRCRGRPAGRRLDSNPSCALVLSTQSRSP